MWSANIPSMEKRDGKAHGLLDEDLELVNQARLLRDDLVVEFVFTEGDDGDQRCAGPHGYPYEALPLVQDQLHVPWDCEQRFLGTADNDSDTLSRLHSLVRLERLGGNACGLVVVPPL